MLYFLNTFLWRILILHPVHTSLFLETVMKKFWGPRVEGLEKQRPVEIDFLELLIFLIDAGMPLCHYVDAGIYK